MCQLIRPQAERRSKRTLGWSSLAIWLWARGLTSRIPDEDPSSSPSDQMEQAGGEHLEKRYPLSVPVPSPPNHRQCRLCWPSPHHRPPVLDSTGTSSCLSFPTITQHIHPCEPGSRERGLGFQIHCPTSEQSTVTSRVASLWLDRKEPGVQRRGKASSKGSLELESAG